MKVVFPRGASDSGGFSLPEVSPAAFLATIWTFTTLSLLFLPARLSARWRTRHRLFWDDFLTTFAWTISLAISVCVTVYMDVTYEVMKIGARLIPFPSNVKIITMQFTRLFIAVPMIFYVGLWSIKLAFLLFFRQLGVRSIRALNRWWWIITGITVVCFGLCYATLPYRCTLVSFKVTASAECQTQGLSFVSMGVNCALDVTTDIMITSIPFIILHRIRISKQQKIALSAIFSLVVLTIIFAIVRATITTIGVKKQMDPTWVYMWTSIELNIAIIVACVAPYRTLFIRRRDSRQQALQPRLSLKDRAFKLFSSSGRSFRMDRLSDHIHNGLPYLAPWPNVQEPEGNIAKHDSHICMPRTPPVTRNCEQPWMTANLPHLEPWRDESPQALSRAHLRAYRSMP